MNGDREFAMRLQGMLRERGLGQVEFERRIGVARGQVSGWLTGRSGITLHNLRKVKEGLGCTWDELLG